MRSSATARRSAERRRIARLIAQAGFSTGPRRVSDLGPSQADRLAKLGPLLRELGPGFSALGLFLADRPDLIPARTCLDLAEVVDAAPSLSEGALDDRLDAELGELREHFAEVTLEPTASRLFHQEHAARLTDGTEVLLRVARPELDPLVENDLVELRALAPVLELDRAALRDLEDQLRPAITQWSDLERQAEALEGLTAAQVRSDRLTPPTVLPDYSTPTLLTLAWPGGADRLEPPAGGAGPDPARARQLALVWLEQALVGGQIALAPEWWLLSDGRLGLLAARVSPLPARLRPGLWEYLRAAADDRAGDAASHLIALLDEELAQPASVDVARRLRQVVPFRDGHWSRGGDTLAEHMVLHWRILEGSGQAPRGPLADFLSGTFSLAAQLHRWAPHHDSLREALTELRLEAGWRSLREQAAPAQIGFAAESQLMALMELPIRLDQLLSAPPGTGAGPYGAGSGAEARSGADRKSSSSTTALALGMAMLAVALLAPRVEQTGLASSSVQAVAASLFLALGLLLLRATGWGR